MKRRNFLLQSGAALGAASLTNPMHHVAAASTKLETWSDIRAHFLLDPGYIHMAQMLLASHPTPVRNAIDKYRKELDLNPAMSWEDNRVDYFKNVHIAAAKYIKAAPEEIALTGSTTQGLAILYNGLKLSEGDEVLTTIHDHYSTHTSLENACQKTGASIRKIELYSDPSAITTDEVVNNIVTNIRDNTRIVAITFVHSSTGVKLPISKISAAVKEVNQNRLPQDRIYLAVDGVHGFGIEDITMEQLGCDFFVAGTHKWIFGPRGTGIVWAKKDAWHMVRPTIPAFSWGPYARWMGFEYSGEIPFAELCTPGGFHAFEHRWALKEAFEFHLEIGKQRVEQRTHYLGQRLRNALSQIPHIKLHTPLSSEFSSGINCFEVDGMKPGEVVDKLKSKKIIASSSPYRISYARLTPAITNTEEEVDKCIAALENIAS